MVDFSSLLETKADDVEKPPVLPQGTYIWTVTKVPAQTTTNNGEWDIVEFPIKAVSAENDVDEDELEEYGSVSAAVSRVAFLFPKDPDKEADVKRTLFRMKKFLQTTLAVDCPEDATIGEMLSASVNCQFLGNCVHRQVDEETYFDVKNYAPLD